MGYITVVSRPPPEFETMQTSIVVFVHWVEELDAQISEALKKHRPGATLSRSEVIREVMAAGLPVIRKKFRLPTPPLPPRKIKEPVTKKKKPKTPSAD